MKKDIKIGAELRTERGKNEARRVRATGRIPAVIYGAGSEAAAISVDPRDINRILFSDTGHNTIFSISVGGDGAKPAMVVDWQHDPVKDSLLHVDIEWIDLSKKITVKIPIQPQGEPKGVKVEGGLFEVVHREVEIECLPNDIPATIPVDVTELMIGDTVRAKDLEIGESIRLLGKREMVVCHVVAARGAETKEEGEEEEVEEPAEPAGEEQD